MTDTMTGLDAGTAVVIGAAVAGIPTLILGLFGPWLKETVERRGRVLEATRLAKAAAIEELVRALGEALKAKMRGDLSGDLLIEAAMLHTRLALLLGPGDREIEVMSATTVHEISEENGSAYLSSFQTVISKWFRGDSTAKEALRTFEVQLRAVGVSPSSED